MRLSSRYGLLGAAAVVMGMVSCSKPKPPAPVVETPPTAAETAPAVPPADASAGLETVYFDFDSSSLNSAGQAAAGRSAASLKGQHGVKVQLEGHCDERGSNEYNLALGERRAQAVREYLTSEGIPAADVSTISYGEERPAEQGSGETAWSKNRRVEMKRL